MSIRRMITFSERGSELLTEATAGARERAAGEYIGAVLTQRDRAWRRALTRLVADGYGLAEVKNMVTTFSRHGYVLPDIAHYLTEEERHRAPLFHDLVLEYDAGNKALATALEAT